MNDDDLDVELVLPQGPQNDTPEDTSEKEDKGGNEEPSNTISLDDEVEFQMPIQDEPVEDTEETTPEDTTEEPEESEEPKTTSKYSAIYAETFGEDPEEDITNAEELTSAINKRAEDMSKKQLEEFKKGLSPQGKLFLDLREYFDDETQAMQMSNEMTFLEGLEDDSIEGNEELQDNLLRRYYTSLGMDEDQVNAELEEADTLGKKADKAKQVAPKLLDKAKKLVEKTKEDRVQAEEKAKENFENMLSSVDEIESLIPNVKLTDAHKKAIKENMQKVAYEDEKGNKYTNLGKKQIENPKHFEYLLQYYDTLGLFDMGSKGDFKPNLTKLTRLAEKKVKSSLDELIQEEQKGGSVNSPKSNKAKSVEDFLKGFPD